METLKSDVDVSFKKTKLRSFLFDLTKLCSKHKVCIYTDSDKTMIKFNDWDLFTKLDVDFEGASVYWPRIQTDIVVSRARCPEQDELRKKYQQAKKQYKGITVKIILDKLDMVWYNVFI